MDNILGKEHQTQGRLRRIYNNMKARCCVKSFPLYKAYGGQGISVCKEWLSSFENFYNWAMENGYSDDLMLDRLDKSCDYCPQNCKWVTKQEKNSNTKRTHLLEINGEVKSVSKWAKHYGIHRCVLNNRLRRGWSLERALTTPTRKYK